MTDKFTISGTGNRLRGAARMKKQPPRYKTGDKGGSWRVLRYAGRCSGKRGHLYDVECTRCGMQHKNWPQSLIVRSETQSVACNGCVKAARRGSSMIIDRELYMSWVTR